MPVAGGAEVYRGPGWFDRAEWLRGPTLLSGDRCRFKDSYGPPTNGRRRGLGRAWRAAFGGEEDDAVVEQRELDLLAQLQEAKAEAQQLRAALRASANAFQKAAALLPPEYQKEVEEQGNLYNDLIEELKRKDEEILRLSKGAAAHANAGARYRRSILGAIERWAPRGEVHLVKCCFDSWNDQHREERLRKRREADVARLRPRIDRLLARWGAFGADVGAKAVLAQWLAVLRAAKAEKLRAAQRQEKVATSLRAMATYYSQGLQAVCWAAWRSLHEARVRDRRAEALRKEHEKIAKEMRAQGVAKAVMELGSDSAAVRVQVLWRAWHECVVQSRAQKALEAARAKAEAEKKAEAAKAEEERRAFQMRARKNMLLHITGSSKACVQACFIAWRDLHKDEKHERDLQKQRQEQVALLEKRRQEFAEREREKKMAFCARMFVEGAGDPTLLGLAWAAWLREVALQRGVHKSELEKAEKAREEEREQARLEHERWQEEAKKDRERIEAEKQKLEEEKQKLVEEAAEADRRREEAEKQAKAAEEATEKGRKESQARQEELAKRRKAIFGFMVPGDTDVLLKMVLVAWLAQAALKEKAIEMREADLREKVKELEEKIEQLEQQKGELQSQMDELLRRVPPAPPPDDEPGPGPVEPTPAPAAETEDTGLQLGFKEEDPPPSGSLTLPPLPPPADPPPGGPRPPPPPPPPPPRGLPLSPRRDTSGAGAPRGEPDPEPGCIPWLCPRRRKPGGGHHRPRGENLPKVKVIPHGCPNGHDLARFRTERPYWCDACEANQRVGVDMDGCLQCDFTVCVACVAEGRRACTRDHPLQLVTVGERFYCNRCREDQPANTEMEECEQCCYHLCAKCCQSAGSQVLLPPLSTQFAPATWASSATAAEGLSLAEAVTVGPPTTRTLQTDVAHGRAAASAKVTPHPVEEMV